MSISLNSRRATAIRVQSEQRRTEQMPESLRASITDLLLPCEQKTPRGTPPSRRLERTIANIRTGYDKTVEKLWTVLNHRKERQEDPEVVVSGLVAMEAEIVIGKVSADDLVPASVNETRFDSAEDAAQMPLMALSRVLPTADPREIMVACDDYIESASAEVSAKRKMIAVAFAVREDARKRLESRGIRS